MKGKTKYRTEPETTPQKDKEGKNDMADEKKKVFPNGVSPCVPQKSPKSIITIAQFKSLLWKEGQLYFGKMNRPFIVDQHNREFLNLISKYWANDIAFEKESNGELRKGLLIYGPCGTGKSSIFDIIQGISRKYHLMRFWFSSISVHDVVSQYNKEGEYVIEKFAKGKVHFDDLGTERLANAWGVKEKLLGRILELRYNEFKHKGTKTFVTTNLTIDELKTFYGNQMEERRNRIADRLYEMFNFMYLGGPSRRF
ncbi:hypothetical protein [Sinomicrobium sp. M5D2P17]